MPVIEEFRTPADYWSKMLEPDYRDCLKKPDDLRAAFHAAISLFHFHEWIWTAHEPACRLFAFKDAKGGQLNAYNAQTFANALEQQCADFGRIRGIANAAKHLAIRDRRPVRNAPSHAANTSVRITEDGQGGYDVGAHFDVTPFDSGAQVMLEGSDGQHMVFSQIAMNVHAMWERLRAAHGW